jgi:hypothetical protein
MLRLLSDEDVHDDIVRGLRRREPTLDIVRAVDMALDHTPDPAILAWAATHERGSQHRGFEHDGRLRLGQRTGGRAHAWRPRIAGKHRRRARGRFTRGRHHPLQRPCPMRKNVAVG